MLISHQSKLIFIHVHRTGGTTITNLLRTQMADIIEIDAQHSDAKTIEHLLLHEYPDYYTFGFVRNPWERIFSWYALLHRNQRLALKDEQLRFEQFLCNDEILNNPVNALRYNSLDYFSDSHGNVLTDDIFRYENFDCDTRCLFEKFQIQLNEIPTTNTTWPKHYTDYYTPKSRELIADKCAKDIAAFGYVFEEGEP